MLQIREISILFHESCNCFNKHSVLGYEDSFVFSYKSSKTKYNNDDGNFDSFINVCT